MIPKDEIPSGSGMRGWISVKLYAEDALKLTIKIKKYFSEYDPRGYDTQIVSAPKKTSGGYWEAHLTRWSTCD